MKRLRALSRHLQGTEARIAVAALAGIAAHAALRIAGARTWSDAPLLAVLAAGGLPLIGR